MTQQPKRVIRRVNGTSREKEICLKGRLGQTMSIPVLPLGDCGKERTLPTWAAGYWCGRGKANVQEEVEGKRDAVKGRECSRCIRRGKHLGQRNARAFSGERVKGVDTKQGKKETTEWMRSSQRKKIKNGHPLLGKKKGIKTKVDCSATGGKGGEVVTRGSRKKREIGAGASA